MTNHGLTVFTFGRGWILAAVVSVFACCTSQASANRVAGSLLGVFSGNDSEAQILTDTGFQVEELAKVETPNNVQLSDPITVDGLTLSNIVFNTETIPEPLSGDWDYADPLAMGRVVDIFVVKAGNDYAAYRYTDAITSNMPNMGLWDTSDVGDKGMSHVTAYRIIPEPSSAVLAFFAIGGIAVSFRRGSTR